MATSPSSILTRFDAVSVGEAARAESRRRELSLPIISLYRWWARRTVAVSSALLKSAAASAGRDQLVVVDPFAGGGVIAASAVLAGHRVLAQEIDPWAASNLAAMAAHGDPADLDTVEASLAITLAAGDPYATALTDGTPARMAYTFRVAVCVCRTCAAELRLFPRALITRTARVDGSLRNPDAPAWFACRNGHVHTGPMKQHPCPDCAARVRTDDRYVANRTVRCRTCNTDQRLGDLLAGDVIWEPVLVQRVDANGRTEFGPLTVAEHTNVQFGAGTQRSLGRIGESRELNALRRQGFDDFADLYPARQFAVLAALRDAAVEVSGVSAWARTVARACVVGTAEFAGHATRWDPDYLKPYETLANHRYATPTLSVEGDPWGERGRGTVRRRLASARRATAWLAERGTPAGVDERHASDHLRRFDEGLTVVTGSSERIPVPADSVDLILTDPPYHDDVQYSDLSALFRVWAGHAAGRLDGDVTAVPDGGEAEWERFEMALTAVFTECRRIVKPDGHLVMSFANREPRAWVALINSLVKSGWYGCGFDVVHSENETDFAKAGRRSCTLDVVLDLVASKPARRHKPSRAPSSAEERYCFELGTTVVRAGILDAAWEERFMAALDRHEFLARTAA